MKPSFILILLILLFVNPLVAKKRDVLITIGNHKITKAEFERLYIKNNQILADELDVKSPKEYIRMYIDFKLKVIEATALHMDTVKSFRDELNGYRNELAAPYLTDMHFDENLVHELYNRMKTEINASHILFRIDAGSTADQEEAVYKKASNVRQDILEGMDFNTAALKYSNDPSVELNKGYLGYFSAFQMVTPFENAAYNLSLGEVSEPVRTNFGYHLIKVNDVRENQGEIKVAHIMKMFPGNGQVNKDQLKAEINLIHQKLLQGGSFEELVALHSDDKRSVAAKGELPWFSAGSMIPELADPAFKLLHKGDISAPVETPFGYHIIKKIDHKPIPPFEEVQNYIESMIKKDPQRMMGTKKAFIEKLKNEYGFEEITENCERLKSIHKSVGKHENLKLFIFAGKDYFYSDFKRFSNIEFNKINDIETQYENWVEHEVIQFENSVLEEKYPEFKYLVQEYHDGLLYFNIMEEQIWNKAANDSAGLNDFYKSYRDKFTWDERFKGTVITCDTPETKKQAEQYISEGLTVDRIEALLNKEKNRISVENGIWEKGTNPAIDYLIWNHNPSTDFNPDLFFVHGEVIAPQTKQLEEAKGLYISTWQDQLERSWIKSLRKKYKIRINKKLLRKIAHV